MSTTTTTHRTTTGANQNAIISKILVAIDGSDASMDAADYAISISKEYNAELYALHGGKDHTLDRPNQVTFLN